MSTTVDEQEEHGGFNPGVNLLATIIRPLRDK
jgi:hypothetical protein